MTIIQKIKTGGLRWIVGAICVVIHMGVVSICKLLPIRTKVIVFESVADCSDNAYALYDYMLKNGYMSRYRAIWLVSDTKKYQGRANQNSVFVNRNLHQISFIRDYYLAVCHYYIYDHNNFLELVGKRKKQIIVNLWHGTAIKATTLKQQSPKSNVDFILSTGKQSTANNAKFLLEKEEKFVELGFPRNDYLFGTESKQLADFCTHLNFENYNKVFLWMPTFRKSKEKNISQDYLYTETGLPLLDNYSEMKKFDEFLNQNNALFLLKVHPLQEELPVFERKFSNILVIKDDDLAVFNVQLYEFISKCDCLITDYSSVYFDFLLTNRPVLFTIDDYEGYLNSRGFLIDNVLEVLAGPHLNTITELKEEIINVLSDIDEYVDQRQRIVSLFYKHPDGHSSKRIIEFLNL